MTDASDLSRGSRMIPGHAGSPEQGDIHACRPCRSMSFRKDHTMLTVQHILMEEGFRTAVQLRPPVTPDRSEGLSWIVREGSGPLPYEGFSGWWATVDYPRDADGRILPGGAAFRLHYGRYRTMRPIVVGAVAWCGAVGAELWRSVKTLFEQGRETGRISPPLDALPLPLDLVAPLDAPWLATIISSFVQGMDYARLTPLPRIVHELAAVLFAEAPVLAGQMYPPASRFPLPLF